MNLKISYQFIFLLILILFLSIFVLFKGHVQAHFSETLHAFFHPDSTLLSNVIWELRFPRLVTALLAGAAMGGAGLLIQTYFENPLADPYVLGIHSGSSLAVTLVMLSGGTGTFSFLSSMGLVGASSLGAFLTLLMLLLFFRFFPSKIMIIVLGLILSYFIGGIVSILWSFSDVNELKNYFLWSLGSFSHCSLKELQIFSLVTIPVLFAMLFLIKPLNLLLLGEEYAQTLGLNIKKIRLVILLMASFLSGSVIAFCGPIAFIGMLAPHAARLSFKKNDHCLILPATFLCGSLIALLPEVFSSFFTSLSLPVNALLSLIGFPWIFFLLLTMKKGGRNEL